METITASRLRAFRSCPRLHYYRYVLRRVPHRGSEATRFGTMFHAGLEYWWMNLLNTDIVDETLSVMRRHYESCAYQDPFELVRAEELMLGYHCRWFDDAEHETLGAEIEWQMNLRNPATSGQSRLYQLRGKVDALVQSRNSRRVFIVEHKTSTADISPGSEYWRRLRLDGQISMYYDGIAEVARERGGLSPDDPTPIAGCIYDVSRRPTLIPYKATAPENRKYTQAKVCKAHKKEGYDSTIDACVDCQPSRLYANLRAADETVDEYRERVRNDIAENPENYYQRGVVVRLEEEMAEHRADLWYLAGTMREMVRANVHPRNVDACVQYNRPCDYFDVCTGVASLTDEIHFKDSDAHPELSKAAT